MLVDMLSRLRRLNADITGRIVNMIPAEDTFIASLACTTLRKLVNQRFADDGGGNSASPLGIVSSLERFQWVRALPDGGPKWLVRWDERTVSRVCLGGGLEVLQYLRLEGFDSDAWNRILLEGSGTVAVTVTVHPNHCCRQADPGCSTWWPAPRPPVAEGARLRMEQRHLLLRCPEGLFADTAVAPGARLWVG